MTALEVRDLQTGFDIEPGEERRAYALGFVLTTTAEAELELGLDHDDGAPSDSITLGLTEAGTYAGIVELDERPLFARRASARVRSEGDASLLDLFVVSYG